MTRKVKVEGTSVDAKVSQRAWRIQALIDHFEKNNWPIGLTEQQILGGIADKALELYGVNPITARSYAKVVYLRMAVDEFRRDAENAWNQKRGTTVPTLLLGPQPPESDASSKDTS